MHIVSKNGRGCFSVGSLFRGQFGCVGKSFPSAGGVLGTDPA